MVSFKRLYKDLTEIPAKNFLTTDQVAYFVTKDIYKKLEPNEWLLQFLEESIKAFSSEIEKLIAIALPKFASSFNTEKGAIFGFGPSAELEPTGNVLKLCNTDSNTLDKLDTHVQIHNLAQEWNVGCINYSLAISGKENLTTVSQRNVIKTAGDLIIDCEPDNYKKYKFQAKDIKDVMKQWSEKMAVLQEQGYDEKKLINAKKESNKLKDLTYLKSQVPPGPFSTADEVCSYIRLPLEENEKNKRLCGEVQYARVLSSTLKETASLFHLKQNGRKLMTQEYADNLIKYMDDTENMSTLTVADLNTVLAQMTGNDGNCETEEPCEDEVIINTINTSYNFCCHFYHIFKNN